MSMDNAWSLELPPPDMERVLAHVESEVEGDVDEGSCEEVNSVWHTVPVGTGPPLALPTTTADKLDKKLEELHMTMLQTLTENTKLQRDIGELGSKMQGVTTRTRARRSSQASSSKASALPMTPSTLSPSPNSLSPPLSPMRIPSPSCDSMASDDGIERMNQAFLSLYMDTTDSSDLRSIVTKYKEAFVKGKPSVTED